VAQSEAAIGAEYRASSRILVVDDEPDIAALVAFHLTRASFQVRTVGDGPETFRAVEAERPDLIVLDVLLPGLSGLEVLRSLHAHPEFGQIPVVLLTARGGEAERIEGLRLGADDYIPKPFSPPELVLRVEAVLRRIRQEPPRSRGRVLRAGPFIVDLDAAQVHVDGCGLDLTPIEFRLLQVLVERQGRVQSRSQLLNAVWETTAQLTTRTVDMHVQRLRTKLGDAAEQLETVRGFGYRVRAQTPRAQPNRTSEWPTAWQLAGR
jgi:two-component system phosphate regulon response regulator PhoB